MSDVFNFSDFSLETCVVIPYTWYKSCYGNRPLNKCKTPYLNYSGDQIPIFGEYVATIQYKSISKRVNVVVSATNSPPLLGRTFLRAFKFDLIMRNTNDNELFTINEGHLNLIIDQLNSEYADVFNDVSLDMANTQAIIFL